MLCVVSCAFPPGESARKIGRMAVSKKLAACVQILPVMTSIYRWQGTLEEEKEQLLLFKTCKSSVSALIFFLEKEHPYEVPEVLVQECCGWSEAYGKWVDESCGDSTEI